MRNICVGLVVLVLTLSVHLGCESGAAKSYTLEEFKVAVAEERCAALVQCGTHATLEDCAHHQLSIDILRNFGELSLAVEEERIAFDGEAAFACAAAIGNPTCKRSSYVKVPAECDAVFPNGLEEGEECIIDQECQTGFQCESSVFPACFRGPCQKVTFYRKGAACFDNRCEEGLYCEKFNPSSSSSSGICEAYALAGESCKANGAMRERICVAGFACVDELCVALPLTGEVCNPRIGCEVENDRCPEGVGVPDPPKCEAGRAPGAACISRECMWNSYCKDGVCTEHSDIGEACDSQTFCQFPLSCISGTCDSVPNREGSCEG